MSKKQSAVIFVLFAVFVVCGLIINFAVEWNEWVKRLSLSVLLFVLVLIYYLTTRGEKAEGDDVQEKNGGSGGAENGQDKDATGEK